MNYVLTRIIYFPLLFCCSECRVWSGSVATVLPSSLPSMPQPQLCSTSGRGGGGSDTRCGDTAELWTTAPGAVLVLDLFLCLHVVCALCCLLEHLRLQLAWRATAPATMTSLLMADKTLYFLFSSTGKCLTTWQVEFPDLSYSKPYGVMTATLSFLMWGKIPDMQQSVLSVSTHLLPFWNKFYHLSCLPYKLTP